MRFDGCFLWVAVPLDRDAAGEAPFGRLAVRPDTPRVLIEDVRIDLFEVVVVLELLFDLAEEGLGDRLRDRDDGDLDLGVDQDVLNVAGKRDD